MVTVAIRLQAAFRVKPEATLLQDKRVANRGVKHTASCSTSHDLWRYPWLIPRSARAFFKGWNDPHNQLHIYG